MKKLLLSIGLIFTMSIANQGNAQTVLFTENFTLGVLPSGWSNDSLGLPTTHPWIFDNQFSRVITGAGFDTSFAIYDSDEGSLDDNLAEDASLTTAPISITGVTGILSLEFDEQYRALGGPSNGGSARRVEISGDGGITWTTVLYDSVDVGYPNPAVHTAINISSVIGSSFVQVRFHWVGDYDWWWAIDNVQLKSFAGCTSAPLAGNTFTPTQQVCSGINFVLSLLGADSGIVISHQWQSSADGTNWSNISGAISDTYTASITTPTYFRCVVSCGGFSANSVPVFMSLKAASLCYCVNGLGGAPCPSTDFISNVSFATTTLNNSDTVCNFSNGSNLSVFAPAGSATAVLTRGNSYSLSVTTSSNNIISIWIDYNQNGFYEVNEWNQVCTTSVAGVANVINVDIPWGAVGGQTGMRVRSRATFNPNDSTSACTNFGSGEAEDYTVTIDIGTGIQNQNKVSNLVVMPNPATHDLTISFSNLVNENTQLKLMNLNGQIVYSESVNLSSSKVSRTIDVSSFAKGIYNLQLISSTGIVTKKVVIQ
jgi:hypothetical protein